MIFGAARQLVRTAFSLRLGQPPRAAWLGRAVPGWVNVLVVGAAGAGVLWAERRAALRPRRESQLRHDLRNGGMALASAITLRLLMEPVTRRLAFRVHRRGWGLLPGLRLPAPVELAAAVVLLDYTLYVWHVLTHKLPFLWRLHRVHHSDLDLDASTAVRFHFGEMALSVPWRALQILVIGAAPLALSSWQLLTLVAILFHHGNVALPLRAERWLCRLLMTPRMHGIHHSTVAEEANSNWSTIFAWPDYVHGTVRLNVPQHAVTVGVPEFPKRSELTLGRLLAMPFGAQRPSWRRPGGSAVTRPTCPGSRWDLK